MNRMIAGKVELDIGRPKVAVPITGRTHEDIIRQCKAAKEAPCDILEWRADYYLENKDDVEAKLRSDDIQVEVIRILDDIEYETGGMPLIFTIRGKSQGGRGTLTKEQVYDLNCLAAQAKLATFIDVELFDDNNMLVREELFEHVNDIHSFGGRVIMSYHDYKSMPRREEIVNIVSVMRGLDADICKIAAYAHNKKDAIEMIKCAHMLTRGENDPVIFSGMGKNGIITRIFGGQYGSVITFASLEEETAIGQPNVTTVNRLLDEYYIEK